MGWKTFGILETKDSIYEVEVLDQELFSISASF